WRIVSTMSKEVRLGAEKSLALSQIKSLQRVVTLISSRFDADAALTPDGPARCSSFSTLRAITAMALRISCASAGLGVEAEDGARSVRCDIAGLLIQGPRIAEAVETRRRASIAATASAAPMPATQAAQPSRSKS